MLQQIISSTKPLKQWQLKSKFPRREITWKKEHQISLKQTSEQKTRSIIYNRRPVVWEMASMQWVSLTQCKCCLSDMRKKNTPDWWAEICLCALATVYIYTYNANNLRRRQPNWSHRPIVIAVEFQSYDVALSPAHRKGRASMVKPYGLSMFPTTKP